jgi:nitrite reductase/ring-hydroxylating ferredoxin subunit
VADFKKVAEANEIAPGESKLVEVGGVRVVVANVEGEFCAFHDECTHDGGPLSEGELEGSVVTCPWHFSKFDVRTGEIVESPAEEEIPVYEVKVEGGAVHVGGEKAG